MGVLAYPDSVLTRSELDFDSADNAPIKQLARFKNYVVGKGTVPVMPEKAVSIDRAVPVELVSSEQLSPLMSRLQRLISLPNRVVLKL